LLHANHSPRDTALREELRVELRHFLSTCDIPVLLVTHDRDEALALGDELVVMSGGTMRQSGPVLDVFNRPADAGVARIVRVENLQPGRITNVTDGLAAVEIGTATLIALAPPEASGNVVVCIRGEDVILQRSGGTASSVRNRLAVRVVGVQPVARGAVELDAGFPLFAYARPACEWAAPGVGDGSVRLPPFISLRDT
jgi:molybdate transport system ATP-binding protein